MSDSMVDRVARAIYAAADTAHEYVGDYTDGAATLDGHFNLKELARAAMETMREPTSSMLEAGQVCIHITGDEGSSGPFTYPSRHEMELAYQAMIDEALNP